MELQTIEKDTAAWRISEVRDRMTKHSRAITSANDFPRCLWVDAEKVKHHVKMLMVLNYGLNILQRQ